MAKKKMLTLAFIGSGGIDHMLHNGPNLAPAGDELVVQQILDGIYRSAHTGREVTVR